MTTDAAADTALPDLENVARSELGETAETRERCLSQLRQLIDADTSLLWPTDEKFLVKYLRCRKYNVELAFNAMRKYFRVRQNSPEFFKALTPYTASYENVILDNHLIMISKHRDPMGRAVAMMKLGAWNTSICPVTDLVRAALVMAEWTLLNEETQIRGVVGVFDLKGLSISHLAHFTPFLLGKLAHIVQFRFLGCDPSTFHGLLPPDCIPAEFGGTHEDFDYSSQHMDVASTSDYFEYVNRFGYGK
ncbi:alpha-tocopherol transfer protein-like isoform X2 [Dermacentor variabilis]|uniref:alpha-tocopherol transfer protein-like isoform X2 n=1 Tax=Dermacentor variabilis TaxID=34621 RepID=UPI003F5B26E9